jgi:uncharacterized protein YbaR (Trm112 family)
VKQRLLDFLVCPVCGGRFETTLLPNKVMRQLKGQFVPSMWCFLPDTAWGSRLVKIDSSEEHKKTAQAFGWQWTHFTEMYETFENQFLDWIYPIQPEFFKGRFVLMPVAASADRYYAAQFGSQSHWVDISKAVDIFPECGASTQRSHCSSRYSESPVSPANIHLYLLYRRAAPLT